ncbi:MAG: permease-like cell division protein FtsX, partial [Acidimicrobiia bacterium]
MDLEKRLQSAANELNQSARNSSPPPLRPASEMMRPWMAFAAAFAVVLAVFGIPFVLTNFDGGGSSDSPPLVGAGSTSTTECAVASTTTAVDAWSGDIHVIAFLNDENSTGVPPGAHDELVTEVESWDEVASVSYFDKNDAWLEYQQAFEGDEELLDIDPTILPATIRIELTDVVHQGEVQSRLEQRTPVVREIQTAPTNDDIDALEEPSIATTSCIEPGVTTTTVVETTTSGTTCDAGELVPPTTVANGDPSYDLTEPVAEKLTAMAAAAGACDAAALASLAADDITTTFGPG